MSQPPEPPPPRIVVGIPGPWKSRSEVVVSIVGGKTGYIAGGSVLLEIETQTAFTLEVCGPDPSMQRAFEIAGQGRFSADQLDEIGRHALVLYVSTSEVGPDAARAIRAAAAACLKAGGFAVKVESAGTAWPKEAWERMAASPAPFHLYSSFVTLVGSDDVSYSCGMHQFGLPDASCPAALPLPEAAELLNTFNMFQIVDSPTLGDGHTFSASASEPVYRLRQRRCEMYPPGDLFHNEYGVWHLEPVRG